MSLLMERNLSFLYGKRSFFTKAVFSSHLASIQTTMHHVTKIFCVSRSLSSFRLTLDAKTYFGRSFCRGKLGVLIQDCTNGMEIFQTAKQKDSLFHSHFTMENLFNHGRKLVSELLHQNTPEILQESELLRAVKSALGLPRPCCETCSKTDQEGSASLSWNDKGTIASSFWHFGEGKWKEVAEKISMYKPEKVIHDAVELVQERIKDIVTNNSLVSHIMEAGDYLSATKHTIKTEAGILSQLWCDRRDHTLACVTEFWKVYCENHTTLETLYSLMNDCVLSHFDWEGLELLSEYIWTTKPHYYELNLLNMMDYPQVDDDGFHFIAEERIPRRSILFIGRR